MEINRLTSTAALISAIRRDVAAKTGLAAAPVRADQAHAVVAMPDHIGTWHALAWAQLLLGDVQAAEASYRSALALDRNFGKSHGGLAIVELLTDRLPEGEASMNRALKLDPGAVSGRYAKSLWLQ